MDNHRYRRYASLVLDVAIDKTLDYGIPDRFVEAIKRGMKVTAPLRGVERIGFVQEVKEEADYFPVQPISTIVHDEEIVSGELFDLALFMAKYYMAPLSRAMKAILPAAIRKEGRHKEQLYVTRLKAKGEIADYAAANRSRYPKQAALLDCMLAANKGLLLSELLERADCQRGVVETLVKKGLLAVEKVQVARSPLEGAEYFKTAAKELSDEQRGAYEKIASSLDEGRYETHLLHGITGSGKTEVYLQAIEKALSLGKGAIMLVPEISLTPQTVERFRSRFNEKIALLHHRLSGGERFDEWHKIREGRAQIAIGARSAVFSPLPNLGLIIVDEEHESSYKQSEEAPCYNARDVAVMRGSMTRSTVILGSATPSLESYHNALSGKYTLSTLSNRAERAKRPAIRIVDMKREYERAKGYTNFSELLIDGIKRRHAVGEQAILFLNRRGYHTLLLCKSCGEGVKCNHCDISLTYHKSCENLACHLCGFKRAKPRACEKCKCPEAMQFKGVGTEQIEKALYALLPELRIIRIDADTTRHKGSHERLLRDFGTGKADLLIGTQMIAKGLHFPQVTLVGVLNSDAALNMPDFRASEGVFQLITQVAGRSGRGSLPGEVIIQSLIPDNRTIALAAKEDYIGYFNEELAVRRTFDYPPFRKMVKICFSGTKSEATLRFAESYRASLRPLLGREVELYPVAPSGHAKVKDRYRYNLLIRGPSVMPINRALRELSLRLKRPSDIKVHIDIDTLNTFF